MDFSWFDNGIQVYRVQSLNKHKKQAKNMDLFNKKTKEAIESYEQTEAQLPNGKTPPLLAKNIMSRPVSYLFPDTTIEQAWTLIKDNRFRHVPVISRGKKKLVGIISDRDLLKLVPKAENIEYISQMMKTKVLTATPDTEIKQIAKVLFEERIGSMPIVEENGDLVGLITRSDILRAIVNRIPEDLWV
ncbi:MAG: CBS domain-containing protein [Desulfobacterales bacterium]|nr:CBS domain-containing protein [Desulfobacterales bacterium]